MRNLANTIDGVLTDGSVLICDRDQKWSRAVLAFLKIGGEGQSYNRGLREIG
jgi:hypothetical protein